MVEGADGRREVGGGGVRGGQSSNYFLRSKDYCS